MAQIRVRRFAPPLLEPSRDKDTVTVPTPDGRRVPGADQGRERSAGPRSAAPVRHKSKIVTNSRPDGERSDPHVRAAVLGEEPHDRQKSGEQPDRDTGADCEDVLRASSSEIAIGKSNMELRAPPRTRSANVAAQRKIAWPS